MKNRRASSPLITILPGFGQVGLFDELSADFACVDQAAKLIPLASWDSRVIEQSDVLVLPQCRLSGIVFRRAPSLLTLLPDRCPDATVRALIGDDHVR